ncbi:MAG: hypothetical protein HDT07_05925 [Bacteroidales bacterium]|nr:hypothetical protein [Bacteroidales bacterium]
MKNSKYLKIFGALVCISFLNACNSANNADEALADYADSFNNQAQQLIPLTPAINSFNARVTADTFYIDVTIDTTVVKPEGLTAENVKTMLRDSFTTQSSDDLGFAETLEATGVKLKYRCLVGSEPILNFVLDASELKK